MALGIAHVKVPRQTMYVHGCSSHGGYFAFLSVYDAREHPAKTGHAQYMVKVGGGVGNLQAAEEVKLIDSV